METAQTTPDWRHEARTLILAGMGHREAARKLGLPEDRVTKWAYRAGLAKDRERAVSAIASTNVHKTTAGEVLQDELMFKGGDSRLLAARIGHESLTVISKYKRQKLLAALPAANEAGSLLQKGNVPGWEQRQQAGSGINLLVHGTAQVLISGQQATE